MSAIRPLPAGRTSRARTPLRWSAGAIVLALLSGCQLAPPRPWERDLHARASMQLDGALGARSVGEQVHAARESASGNASVGGGGCGCN